jgi:hypothetical protein
MCRKRESNHFNYGGMGLGAMPGIEVEDLTRVDHLELYIYKIIVYARSKKDRSTLSVPLNVLRQ